MDLDFLRSDHLSGDSTQYCSKQSYSRLSDVTFSLVTFNKSEIDAVELFLVLPDD